MSVPCVCSGEGPNAAAAYKLILEAEKYIPDDPLLSRLTQEVCRYRKITSEPAGAAIYIKPYAEVDSVWRYLGETPADSVRLVRGFLRIKLEKNGYQAVEDIAWINDYNRDSEDSPPRPLSYRLSETGSQPEGMVLLPHSSDWYDLYPVPKAVHLPGSDQLDRKPIGDFLMDRYEVTNRDYKRFVDSGGYEDPAYWKHPFVKDGKVLSWEDAMALFRDKTRRKGPATWQVGDYPDDQDDYPVSGVSWYEAEAYAEFVGKSLPSIYHWDRAAFVYAAPAILLLSNSGGDKGPTPVGRFQSLNRFGVNDLAGNVREWVFNESSRGGRCIMGGGWNDPTYLFPAIYAQPPFDRSETNGFRCIQYNGSEENRTDLEKILPLAFRDFENEEPVSDEIFAHYLSLYAYDKTELNAVEERGEEHEDWFIEKVTFDAAYGKDERMSAYLFLPKQGTPPYQTVIYFPGSSSIFTRSSKRIVEDMRLSSSEMFPKSGRAFLYPIYQSTFERGDDLRSISPTETILWKEHVIMWAKDLSRSIDYLETRDDIDADALAYYGFSWGGFMGATLPAIEKRIKASVIYVAGLLPQRSLPEVEPIHYLPRVKTPTLMINEEQDFFFPYTSKIYCPQE